MSVVDTTDTIEAIWIARLNERTNPINSTDLIFSIILGFKAIVDTMADTTSIK